VAVSGYRPRPPPSTRAAQPRRFLLASRVNPPTL